MSFRRVLEVLAVSTATLAQGSRDVDLFSNASDWKQLNITKGNNTFQLAYSMSFPEGREDLEQYASCVTDAIEKDVTRLPNVTDKDVNTTQLLCNTTTFFTPKNKSLILNTQVSSLSPEQCELLENMTWVMIYSTCMNQTDQNHAQSDNTQKPPQHYSAQSSQDNGNSQSDWKLIIGVTVGALTFFAIVLASVKAYAERDDLDSPAPTPRGPGLK